MGTSLIDSAKRGVDARVTVIPGSGPVIQVAQPTFAQASPGERMSLLGGVSYSDNLPSEAKLLLTAGGFIELDFGPTTSNRREIRGPDFLDVLHRWTLSKLIEEVRIVGISPSLDVVLGIDVTVDGQKGVGQFAALITNSTLSLVPKRFPIGTEADYLAGVASDNLNRYPRVFDTKLGRTLILVCHDVNAVHPRQRVLVGNAKAPTSRTLAIRQLDQDFSTLKSGWALNLVHSIESRRQTQTFRTSYRTLSGSIIRGINVAGSFGYGTDNLNDVPELLDLMVSPNGPSMTKVIIES